MGTKTSKFRTLTQKYSVTLGKKKPKAPKKLAVKDFREKIENILLNKHTQILLSGLNRCLPTSKADHTFKKALENNQIKTKSDLIKYIKLHDEQSKKGLKKEQQSHFTNTLHYIAKKINLEKAPSKSHEKNRHNWRIRKLLSSITNIKKKQLKNDKSSSIKTASSKETTQPKVDLPTKLCSIMLNASSKTAELKLLNGHSLLKKHEDLASGNRGLRSLVTAIYGLKKLPQDDEVKSLNHEGMLILNKEIAGIAFQQWGTPQGSANDFLQGIKESLSKENNTAEMTEVEKAEVTAAKEKLEEACNDLKSLLPDIDKLAEKVRAFMEKRQNELIRIKAQ